MIAFIYLSIALINIFNAFRLSDKLLTTEQAADEKIKDLSFIVLSTVIATANLMMIFNHTTGR